MQLRANAGACGNAGRRACGGAGAAAGALERGAVPRGPAAAPHRQLRGPSAGAAGGAGLLRRQRPPKAGRPPDGRRGAACRLRPGTELPSAPVARLVLLALQLERQVVAACAGVCVSLQG